MTGPAAIRAMPVQVAPPGETAQHLLFYIFVAIVYLAMFGIRVLPDFSVSFSLVAVYGLAAWLLIKGQASFDLAARGLKAAVAYYPSCQQQFDRDVAVPLLILIGDKDDWTPADNCRKLQSAGFRRPDLVEVGHVNLTGLDHGSSFARPAALRNATARMAALRPPQSPPLVKMPIRLVMHRLHA